ncbi:MAG: hypothetical protein Q4D04_14095 [Clostridia bacterium]|nr:hypothetical protein [Clostridia bacterium]
MKRLLPIIILMLVLSICTQSALAEEAAPGLVEAKIVTEVLDWGETVTALRLEYSEEIWCGAVEYSNERPGKITYSIINDRDITNLYVNNSGKKDDVQLTGKYVFINLGIPTQDDTKYRDYVVFNSATRVRDRISPYYIFQHEPIETLSGNVIPGNQRYETSGEICVVVDDFTTFTYQDGDYFLNYHLYIPEGYEEKDLDKDNLPLVVHYPAGDYRYTDYQNLYRGALFSHPDAVFWATEEAQAANPAFVITVGGERDAGWSGEFSGSIMQQSYVAIIKQLCETYNIDPARIYAISLAGGSSSMFYTVLGNPDLFAGYIATSFDPYELFDTFAEGESFYSGLIEEIPGWIFTGFDDNSGSIEGDTRYKGERLRDVAMVMNENGHCVDIAYGEAGELMWNGLLRGVSAEAMAQAQVDRASESAATSLVTMYIPGTIKQTMHWCWNATYSNAVVRNWLFQQVNENPML